MGWIAAIIVGAIIGIIASMIMRTREGILAEILIGIVGAALGKFIFADLLGIGSATSSGDLTVWGVVWGIIGAVILLAILKALHLVGSNNTTVR